MKVVIRTDQSSKYYGRGGEIKAVDELDLGVYEGATFGLLSPDRLGKTTTIRMYAWLYEQMSTNATLFSGCKLCARLEETCRDWEENYIYQIFRFKNTFYQLSAPSLVVKEA